MRVAIFASKGVHLPKLDSLLPEHTSEILVGGPGGIRHIVRNTVLPQGIAVREFLPDHEKYGRKAKIMRDAQIIDSAEYVLALWDGRSRDIPHLLRNCSRPGVPFCILQMDATKPQ